MFAGANHSSVSEGVFAVAKHCSRKDEGVFAGAKHGSVSEGVFAVAKHCLRKDGGSKKNENMFALANETSFKKMRLCSR